MKSKNADSGKTLDFRREATMLPYVVTAAKNIL
jgi:hypothetical protein